VRLRRNAVPPSSTRSPEHAAKTVPEEEHASAEKSGKGDGSRGKKALFWRFGQGQRGERGKRGGREGGGEDIELLEGSGECSRKLHSGTYDMLMEGSLYEEDEEHAQDARGASDLLSLPFWEEGEPSRKMYKAPSYYALLRDNSEPLDCAVVDGYLPVVTSTKNSPDSSEKPAPTPCNHADGATTAAAARAPAVSGEAGKTGRNLFSVFGRKRQQPAASSAAYRAAESSRLPSGSTTGEHLGFHSSSSANSSSEEEECSGEGGSPQHLATSPWDSGISLERGFFDTGSCRTLHYVHPPTGSCSPNTSSRMRQEAMQLALKGGRRRSREEWLRVPVWGSEGGVGRGNESLYASTSSSMNSRRSEERIRRRRHSDEGSSSAQERYGMHRQRELQPPQRLARRARSDTSFYSARDVTHMPRVTFSPVPIPPEMDPTRPPIEVGSWQPGKDFVGRATSPSLLPSLCNGVYKAVAVGHAGGGGRGGEGGLREMRCMPAAAPLDMSRENQRPNVPPHTHTNPRPCTHIYVQTHSVAGDDQRHNAKEHLPCDVESPWLPKLCDAGDSSALRMHRDIRRCTWSPASSVECRKVGRGRGGGGEGQAGGTSECSELLHARLFENLDFIEEYLELYNLGS